MAHQSIPMKSLVFVLVLIVSVALAISLPPGGEKAHAYTDVWNRQDSKTGQNLCAVTAYNDSFVWAVGDVGTITNTTNGGSNWNLQHSGTSRNLNGVSAVDNLYVWAVGDNGTILHTTDGGTANWNSQHSYTSLDFYAVAAADRENVWAVGEKGLVSDNILHTEDGGRSWHHQYGPLFHIRELYGVAAANKSIAWVVGERGTIWNTTNKGSDWNWQTSGTDKKLTAVSAASTSVAWAVGDSGTILYTGDGGAHWHQQGAGVTSQNLRGVTAASEGVAWAVGDGGAILKTVDGGANWIVQESGVNYTLLGVSAGDTENAWASGVMGVILHGMPKPVIAGCTPNDVIQGHTDNIYIVGTHTHFKNKVSVATFSGTGITVNYTDVTDATHATANITVDPAAPTGARDVNVITGTETPDPLVGGLTVHQAPPEPPRLDRLHPGSGPVGTYMNLFGQHFGNARGSSRVTFNGTRVSNYTSWSDSRILCRVPGGATTGPVVVTTPVGTSPGIDFTVTETTTPRIATCYPIEAHQGHEIDLHIVGSNTHFVNGTSTTTISGTGVTVNSTAVSDSTHATADIVIEASAPPGPRDINVITGDETPDPLIGVFTVQAAYTTPPTLRGITPDSGPVGTQVSITGTNFGQARGSSEVTFNGITVTKYISWSDHEIVCTVPYGATTGLVEVETPWGNSSGMHFTVTPFAFYFAEGTCRPNFDPYICIQNPGETDAEVRITYMKGDGTTQEQDLNVTAHTRSTVTVKNVLGEGDDPAHDFSARVECASGQAIIVERPMYFNYHGIWTGGHDVIGALAPAPAFYFAEGTCRPNFDPYICIQNPGDTDAEVRITYMKGDGTTHEQDLTVGATTRSTVTVKDTLGEGDDPAHDFSARVECTNEQEIVVERPMYFNYQSVWTGGSDVVGALAPASAFYFAEGTCRPGFQPYMCIQNPGSSEADVLITYMKGDGTTQEQSLTVGATTRSTVTVNSVLGEGDDVAHDFSAKVECTNGQRIICERPMYFNYHDAWTGGSDVVGDLAPASAFYFAEGTCRPDFDAYICIQNPELAHASVRITYMRGDGTTAEQEIGVEASSRATVTVKDFLGSADDAAHDFSAKVECSNGLNIICERPMYFNYKGAWTGGHDVVGLSP